ncbi:MAG TPA: flagellar hook-basal body protein [Dissulfurispiraceae bacterium]|nr:flagellar hook-basal body protein [Dissulfurispiraceae bacterium]
MYKGIYTAITGSNLKMMELDHIANNLANISTNGYKRTSFSSRLYPIIEGLSQTMPAKLPEARAMAWTSQYSIDAGQGMLQMTGNPLDTAINGEGFFVVDVDGSTNYTRNGSFTVDKEGFLVTSGGHKIIGESGKPIKIGKDIKSAPVISADGTVTVEGNIVGKLKTVKITDVKYVSDSLFTGKEAGQTKPEIKQGSIERSNVNPVRELVAMITAEREFQSLQQTIRAFDQLSQRAASEIAKV